MLTAEQQITVLQWLENLRDNGLTLNEVIEGLTNGTLTTVNQPEPHEYLHDVSKTA